MKKNLSQLGYLAAGMIVCLTMSSCTTFRNTENADEDLYGANTQEGQMVVPPTPWSPDDLFQVNIEMVAFRMKDVEKLILAENMTKGGLFRLWKAGKAKLLASTSVVTRATQDTNLRAVQELLYPSEFNITNGVIEPQNFTMREIGIRGQVILNIDENAKTINIHMMPQLVSLERWISTPAEIGSRWNRKTLPFPQPVIGVTSFESQLMVKDGETVLLGSVTTPDGEWVNAGFLTVSRLGAKSQK